MGAKRKKVKKKWQYKKGALESLLNNSLSEGTRLKWINVISNATPKREGWGTLKAIRGTEAVGSAGDFLAQPGLGAESGSNYRRSKITEFTEKRGTEK